MNLHDHPPAGDSQTCAVDQLSFDILRALLANRQATSPTVRALAGQQDGNAGSANPAVARMRMLAGHAGAAEAQDAAGNFFSLRGDDSRRPPENGDHPVSGSGERHA